MKFGDQSEVAGPYVKGWNKILFSVTPRKGGNRLERSCTVSVNGKVVVARGAHNGSLGSIWVIAGSKADVTVGAVTLAKR